MTRQTGVPCRTTSISSIVVCAGLAAVLAACAPKKEAPKAAAPEVSVVEWSCCATCRSAASSRLGARSGGRRDPGAESRVIWNRSTTGKARRSRKGSSSHHRRSALPGKARGGEGRACPESRRVVEGRPGREPVRPLAEERAVSQAELDNAVSAQNAARAQVDAAQASSEKASLDLGYTRVTAPISGLTGRAQRKVGDLVGKVSPRC